MTYQKCPVCLGAGYSLIGAVNTNINRSHCHTCNGSGIISELTGLPPDGIKSPEIIDKEMNDLIHFKGKRTPELLLKEWNDLKSIEYHKGIDYEKNRICTVLRGINGDKINRIDLINYILPNEIEYGRK